MKIGITPKHLQFDKKSAKEYSRDGYMKNGKHFVKTRKRWFYNNFNVKRFVIFQTYLKTKLERIRFTNVKPEQKKEKTLRATRFDIHE